MPMLTFRGIDESVLLAAKEEIIEKLCVAIDRKPENLTFLLEAHKPIHNVYPFIEFKSIPRPKHLLDAIVDVLCTVLAKHGINDLRIGFTYFQKTDFYVNRTPLE